MQAKRGQKMNNFRAFAVVLYRAKNSKPEQPWLNAGLYFVGETLDAVAKSGEIAANQQRNAYGHSNEYVVRCGMFSHDVVEPQKPVELRPIEIFSSDKAPSTVY